MLLLDLKHEENNCASSQASPFNGSLSGTAPVNDGSPVGNATPRADGSATVEEQAGLEGEDTEREKLRSVLMKRLLGIHGIGPFAAQNVLQLLGFTEVDAYDSETIR